MLRVFSCIAAEHDDRLVLLAGLICLSACYTAVNLLARSSAADGRARLFWRLGAALVAGSGVWATHFLAMLAFRPNLPVGFEPGLTALSIVIAIAFAYLGFSLAQRGGRLSPLGGVVIGAGVGAMHYVGMAALRVPADFAWDRDFVIASLAIGTVAGAVALPLVLPVGTAIRRGLAATILAFGIFGLHFTAMAAVTLTPDPLIASPQDLLAPEWLAATIAAVIALVIGLGLAGAIFDQHLARLAAREATLRGYVVELENTRSELQKTTYDLTEALSAAAAGSQAKSQFLATMSHELRTPLNAIIGFSEVLADAMFGPLGNPRYQDYARDICNSGQHLLALINDVLDLSKLDAGHLLLHEEELDLAAIIHQALRMLHGQAQAAGVQLSAIVGTHLPFVRADHKRLKQILLNLLSNAIKFTPADGHVRVVALHEDGRVGFSVEDTGIGIAAEDLPKVLERFVQVDSGMARKYQGTGLGLPLAKRLAELHGGELKIASTVGAGTTVTVFLPAARTLSGHYSSADAMA